MPVKFPSDGIIAPQGGTGAVRAPTENGPRYAYEVEVQLDGHRIRHRIECQTEEELSKWVGYFEEMMKK